MGFKLVRVDATEPYKVSLPIGSHLVGRGKFLDCNDNRVSRNHAELVVTSDSVILKSLHQNPCFLKKKSSTETLIYSKPDSKTLSNGDRFGLIPDAYWYEVILTEELSDEPLQNNQVTFQNENPVKQSNGDNTSNTEFYDNDQEMLDCSDSVLDAMVNSPFNLPEVNQTSSANDTKNEPSTHIVASSTHNESTNKQIESTKPIESTNRPSVDETKNHHDNLDVTTMPSEESTNKLEVPIKLPGDPTNLLDASTNQSEVPTNLPDDSENLLDASTNQSEVPTNLPDDSTKAATPTKRPHSEEISPCDLKRVKTEPIDKDSKDEVKTEPNATAIESNQAIKTEPDSPQNAKPGPSNDQGSSSNNGNPAMPPSPAKPPNKPLRERCMYGANCYRRNPAHKAQFSHPADADWGAGERGACPWGAACARADPRHWRDHEHPPGTVQPPPGARRNIPGMQVVRRHGNNFYINANSVHFYDDHFEVEESDGDSVDYDYEF